MQQELLSIIESFINGNISYATNECKELDGSERAELLELTMEYYGTEEAMKLAKAMVKAL